MSEVIDKGLAIVYCAHPGPAVIYDGRVPGRVPTTLVRPGIGFGQTAEDYQARQGTAQYRTSVKDFGLG